MIGVRVWVSVVMEKAAWARAARAYVSKLIEAAEIFGADLTGAEPQ